MTSDISAHVGPEFHHETHYSHYQNVARDMTLRQMLEENWVVYNAQPLLGTKWNQILFAFILEREMP